MPKQMITCGKCECQVKELRLNDVYASKFGSKTISTLHLSVFMIFAIYNYRKTLNLIA